MLDCYILKSRNLQQQQKQHFNSVYNYNERTNKNKTIDRIFLEVEDKQLVT